MIWPLQASSFIWNKKRQIQTQQSKKEFEKSELFARNLTWNGDSKQSKRIEATVKGNINGEKYTVDNSWYGKAETFF